MADEEELPSGWKKWWSERRKKYYYHNEETGVVQWNSPVSTSVPPSPSKSEKLNMQAPQPAGKGVSAARTLVASTEQPDSSRHSKKDDAAPPTLVSKSVESLPPAQETQKVSSSPLPHLDSSVKPCHENTANSSHPSSSNSDEEKENKSEPAENKAEQLSMPTPEVETQSAKAEAIDSAGTPENQDQSVHMDNTISQDSHERSGPTIVELPDDVGEAEVEAVLSEAESNEGGTFSEQMGQETIQLLQNLLSYYNYDPNAANLVQMTLQTLPSACIDERDEVGNTLLLLAIQYNAHDIVKALIDKGADVTAVNTSGSCPLHYASSAENYNRESVLALLEAGAMVDQEEGHASGAFTPLHYAAQAGNLEACSLLLDQGADPNRTDAYGRTACDLALEQGQVECAELFSTDSGLKRSSSLTRLASNVSETMDSQGHTMKGNTSETIIELIKELRVDLQKANDKLDVQRKEYESVISKKDQALGDHQDSFSKLQAEHGSIQLQCQRLKHDFENSERRMLEAEKLAKKLEVSMSEERAKRDSSAEELTAKVTELEASLAAESKKLELANTAKENALNEVREERDKASESLQEHMRVIREGANNSIQLAQKVEQVNTLHRELQRSEESLKAKDLELESLKESSHALRQKSNSMEAECVKLRESSIHLTAALESTRMQLASEEERANKLFELIEALQTDNVQLKSDVQSIQDEVCNSSRKSHFEEELVKAKTQVSVLQSELDRLKAAESQHLLADQSRLAIELATLKEENSRLQTNLSEAKVKSDLDEHNQEMAEELEQAKSQIKELRAQAMRRSSRNDMLEKGLWGSSKSQKHKLESALHDAQQQLSEYMGKCTELQLQVDELIAEVNRLKELLSAKDIELESRVSSAIESTRRDERENASNSFESQIAAIKESSAIELNELKSQLSKDMEKERLELTNALNAAQAQAAEEEARRGVVEKKLHEVSEAHTTEIKKVQREFEEERRSLAEKNERDLDQIKKQLVDERAQSKEELDRIEAQRSEAVKQITELKNHLESQHRQFTTQIREAEDAKLSAETKLNSMTEMIEKAKEIDKINARLDADMIREVERRKKLHDYVEDLKGKIRVYVRVRPMSESETKKKSSVAYTQNSPQSLTYFQPDKNPPEDKKNFDFDKVFAGGTSEGNAQGDVFEDVKQLVLSCVEGRNVCIFAYGQTGSGKTFTMVGPGGQIGDSMDESFDLKSMAGVTPRAIVELFHVLEERDSLNIGEVDVSMYELYCDALVDLLGEKKPTNGKKESLNIRLAQHTQSGLVEVENGTVRRAQNVKEVMEIMDSGMKHRSTHATKMNAVSSRSHLVMMLVVRSTNRRSGQSVVGKLTLVDLAGSERVDKSGAEGQRLKEAASINKSLSAIGDVVGALTTNTKHIPYRNHALTTLMSDSIGGSAKTVMIVCCSPADYNTPESINSLSFAQRCKNVKNMVAASPAQAAAQVQALKQELARLKKSNTTKADKRQPR